MPHIIPSVSDIRDTILRDIKNQLPQADVGPDSDFFVRASSVASAVRGVYQDQQWIARQIFPDTADHDFLLMHARLRNLTPKPATPAGGQAQLSGTPNSPVASGLTFRYGNGQTGTTLTGGTLDAGGKLTVNAAATTTGIASNVPDGTPGTLLIAPTGVSSQITLKTMTGGTDDESDESLLARLLELIRQPPAGGNKYDYHRWAMEVPGVTAAYVYPMRRGLGTVDVVITSGNDLPSQATIDAAQAHIDDLRPVTAKNSLVLAPTPRSVDFHMQVALVGLTLADAKVQIQNTLVSYFTQLAPGDTAVLFQIGALISAIPGITDLKIILPAANVTPVVDEERVEWVRMGGLIVELMP
ncbi:MULTISPECIES: baseplate J/gp47 family protein [Serratia]|uniref:baseplate J/gp47 family protein n=1 Tax=Serratia TaxID=613 RepID=UPI000660EE26|nr:baseplate J/gp47 family protein [Serratia sp. 506_PEND]HBC7419259.1 baseplate J/gp47 family protein [Serratia marcescens]